MFVLDLLESPHTFRSPSPSIVCKKVFMISQCNLATSVVNYPCHVFTTDHMGPMSSCHKVVMALLLYIFRSNLGWCSMCGVFMTLWVRNICIRIDIYIYINGHLSTCFKVMDNFKCRCVHWTYPSLNTSTLSPSAGFPTFCRHPVASRAETLKFLNVLSYVFHPYVCILSVSHLASFCILYVSSCWCFYMSKH